jgi:hypothetical protein
MKSFRLIILTLGTALAVSCIDENYDLGRINTDIEVLKDVEVPVGSVSKLTVGDLIPLEEAKDVLQVREGGDYWIYYQGEPIRESVEIPIGDFGTSTSGVDDFAANCASPIGLDADFGTSADMPFSTSYNFSLEEEDFPVEIRQVYHISGSALVTLRIGIADDNPFRKVTLKDLTVEFPAWLELDKAETAGFTVEGTQMKASAPVELNEGSVMDLVCSVKGFDISHVPEGQGILPNTPDEAGNPRQRLSLNDSVVLTGTASVRSADRKVFSGSISGVKMTKELVVSDIHLTDVRVSFAVSRTLEGTTIKLGDNLPVNISGESRIDPYEVRLFLSVSNPFPIGASVYTGVKAHANDADGHATEKYFPLGTAEDPYVLNAGGMTNYCFYRRDPSGLEGYREVSCAGLVDFLYPIPEELVVEDIHVASSADDVTIPIQDQYPVSVDYRVEAPLAFGENMSIALDYEMKDTPVDLGENVSFREARLFFTVENTLPLSFGIDLSILDGEGKPVDGISIVLGKADAEGPSDIPAGTLGEPASERMAATLSVAEGQTLRFSGLRFKLHAGAPKVGAILNENQGLEIKDISLKLTSGVTMDLGNIVNP